ncbi:hypothetical protein [Lentilitoribacter sp. Alg239-R112]|jgi:hypothetical protein|uniref:hypothetical protein n=1 Tax=Lentilitoribacter sp. Alg239-R112 TaxID=2305987 RepID=UPI0013A6D7D7|nr:hypothetical protein [Lentilitoribacter sp. Alg239-R112]
MLFAIPLMLIPFILYNVVMLGPGAGIGGLENQVMELSMLSGANWIVNVGDLFILIALVLLFIEILKSTRTGPFSVLDHMLSMFVFIAFLVEFLLVKGAATQIFFVLMAISFIDVIAGFSVSIKSAGRDVSIGL